MKCNCGEELIFNDNSISKVGHECYPLYYCIKCEKVWNAYALEDEDDPEFLEEKDEKYKKWFTRASFMKIKYWYRDYLGSKIREYDNIIDRLN